MPQSTDLARLTTLAINKMSKKKVEPIMRSSYLLGELQRRGKISYNNGGLRYEWRPRIRRRDLNWGPGNPITASYNVTNVHTVMTLDYKVAWLGEAIREIETLALADQSAAYFTRLERIVDQCMGDFKARFAPRLYTDGVGTNRIEGFESCGGTTGSALTGVPVADPSDTYAGRSTVLGTNGDWDAPSGRSWPEIDDESACDYEYHALSPLVVDYNNTNLIPPGGSETAAWDDLWEYACNYGLTYMSLLYGTAPDVLILNADLLRRAQDSLRGDFRFAVDANPGNYDVAVRQLNFNGVKYVSESGVPASTGYGVIFDALELHCMGDQLVKTKRYDDSTTADELHRFAFHGQLVIDSPAYMLFLKAISAEGT
tara:strand:- start:1893 stop:3005 length:1113 start_codon:yes stop_codon:yes gene_type:complete